MSNKGKELYDQGNEERLRGNYDRCVSLWKNAATWFKNQGYQKQTSTILSDIGFLYYQLGQYDTAERYFNNSLVITKSINYKEHEGWNINYLGLIYQRRGELEKAFENFLEALKIAEFVGDTIGENQCLNNIGSVYYRKGDLNEALKYFKKSLDIVMRENDLEGKERCFNNIASVYFSWKNFERALEYYNSSLEILRLNEKENRLKIGRRLHNLGQVFRSLGNQNQAIFLFGESLEITKATSDKHSLGIISHSLGETYLDMKQADLALEYLKTSYQVAIDENDTRGLVRILIDQGLGYKYKKQYREAFKRFGDALNLAKPFADQESIAICYNNMGRIYQLQRNYLEAINYYEEAFKVLDEFYSIVPSEDIRIEARIQLNTVLNNLVQSLTIISDFDKALAYIDYNKGREMLLTQIEAYRSPFFILNEKIPKSESMQEKSELVQLRDEINSLKQQLSNIKNKLKWYQDQSKLGNKEILDVEEARLMKKQKAILTTLRSKEEEVFIRFPTQGLVLPKNPIKIIQEIHSKIISGWLIIEFYYDREREKLMVFWIEKKKKTEMREKGLTNEEMKRLEDTAKKIIELRSKAKVDSRYEAEDCLIKLSNLLFEVLFPKELKSYLKNNQFEFITLIPTGALHTLPLELIHDGNEFWSLKYNISRAFNLQTLLAAIHGTQTSQEESGLFIVAPLVDMDIKVEELVPYMGTGTLDKLNRTAETTAKIIDLLEEDDFPTKLLMEQKHTIIEHFNKYYYSIIHFGGHAFFNGEYPETSFLLIKDGSKPFKLTANDISMHVNFLGSPFIFLCACETGGIETRVGDELFGLARGFICAGASGLLISGWRIFERSAGDFAEKFYQYFKEKDPITKAIRKARQFIRKKAEEEEYIADPFNLLHWGAFRYYGLPYTKIVRMTKHQEKTKESKN